MTCSKDTNLRPGADYWGRIAVISLGINLTSKKTLLSFLLFLQYDLFFLQSTVALEEGAVKEEDPYNDNLRGNGATINATFNDTFNVTSNINSRISLHNPRSEEDAKITSGEKAWHAYIGKDFDDVDNLKNEDHGKDNDTTLLNNTTTSHSPQARFPLSTQLLSEFHPFASLYGLDLIDTEVDRPTYADLVNDAEEGDNAHSMYLVGLIHFYGHHRRQDVYSNHNRRNYHQQNHQPHNNQSEFKGKNDHRYNGENSSTSHAPDILSAIRWFNRASALSHPDAQCALGILLLHGVSTTSSSPDGKIVNEVLVGRDVSTAMSWFRRAVVDSDHSRGNFLLGSALLLSPLHLLLKKEKEESQFLVSSPHVRHILSKTSGKSGRDEIKKKRIDEEGPEKEGSVDYEEVARLFRRAAADGIAEAIHGLGVLYEYGLVRTTEVIINGENVNDKVLEYSKDSNISPYPNPQLAARLYHRSSNLGYAESTYHLGLLRLQGRGVTKDTARAISLFQKADALSGKHACSSVICQRRRHCPSLRQLAHLVLRGQGVVGGNDQNVLSAMKLLEDCKDGTNDLKLTKGDTVKIYDHTSYDNAGNSYSADLCKKELYKLKEISIAAEKFQNESLTKWKNASS